MFDEKIKYSVFIVFSVCIILHCQKFVDVLCHWYGCKEL